MDKKSTPFSVFQDLAEKKGYRPKRATTSLKKENVQFIFQTPSHKDIEVDLKTKKRFKNKSFDKWIWIEFADKYGRKGWVYGRAKFIAFETADSFILVNRSELADFLQRTNVARFDLPFVDQPWKAKYRVFRRPQTKETLTQIKTHDLLKLKSVQVWKKYE
jgi:hypothetical protein